MTNPSFTTPAPPTSFTTLTYPTPQILLVTLSRPRSHNCINNAGHWELHAVWEWFDAEPSLRVGVVTGEGGRAFCAGADLKEWSAMVSSSNPPPTPIPTPTQARPGQQQQQQHNHYRPPMPPTGFGGLTLRRGKKPIIAAVNGLAHGGGFEILTNVDIVLASPHATFVLPEVKRGVVAIAGALPRLPRIVGRMRAMEMVLLGREIGVWEGVRWGFVNAVADAEDEGGKTGGGKGEGVVAMAVRWAREIAERNSPDAVVVSKAGVDMAWEGAGGVTEASERIREGELWRGLERGENMREGLRAFGEKRAPRWVDSKL